MATRPLITQVEVAPLPPERYTAVLGPDRREAFEAAIRDARHLFAGRTIWNINSTAAGGGVAEMLQSLLAYARGAEVDARWLVIAGDADFFLITKRIHNNLHDFEGDGGALGDEERVIYERTLDQSFAELAAIVQPRDVVLLHDPQTAGLIPGLKRLGVPVIWRCHVGIDDPDDHARRAWSFLLPYVEQADACVFSRPSFVWDELDRSRVVCIAPSIDAFSPKNADLEPDTVSAILEATGLVAGGSATGARPTFVRRDGSVGVVARRSRVFEDAPARPTDRLVVQVSRWDALKDPIGVIEGFARYVAPRADAHLVYAGPELSAVADDPEGQKVLDESVRRWGAMPAEARARIHLACIPMVDVEENAAIVNALQRRASVVAQKSLAEGFGLTVAEAMWKGRPVVASRIGGIQDQIEQGKTGILVEATDLSAFGDAVLSLLRDPDRAAAMGAAAMERVRDLFLGARSLLDYTSLIQTLIEKLAHTK